MDPAEKAHLRREILEEVGALFYEHLAASEWGRALVSVVHAEKGRDDALWRVDSIDVEDIVGDEQRIEKVFSGATKSSLLSLLAQATEALAALDDIDLNEVRGGTFVRIHEGGFAWLPGLVRTPSPAFERMRDQAVQALTEKQKRLLTLWNIDDHSPWQIDLDTGAAAFSKESLRASVLVIGSFSSVSHSWTWGWANRSLSEQARAVSREMGDAISERALWEITTPQFATDKITAWALSAIVCNEVAAEGVLRLEQPDGAVFLLLRELARVS